MVVSAVAVCSPDRRSGAKLPGRIRRGIGPKGPSEMTASAKSTRARRTRKARQPRTLSARLVKTVVSVGTQWPTAPGPEAEEIDRSSGQLLSIARHNGCWPYWAWPGALPPGHGPRELTLDLTTTAGHRVDRCRLVADAWASLGDQAGEATSSGPSPLLRCPRDWVPPSATVERGWRAAVSSWCARPLRGGTSASILLHGLWAAIALDLTLG